MQDSIYVASLPRITSRTGGIRAARRAPEIFAMPAHGNGTCVRMENAARDFGQMFRLDNLSADFLMTVAALRMTAKAKATATCNGNTRRIRANGMRDSFYWLFIDCIDGVAGAMRRSKPSIADNQ